MSAAPASLMLSSEHVTSKMMDLFILTQCAPGNEVLIATDKLTECWRLSSQHPLRSHSTYPGEVLSTCPPAKGNPGMHIYKRRQYTTIAIGFLWPRKEVELLRQIQLLSPFQAPQVISHLGCFFLYTSPHDEYLCLGTPTALPNTCKHRYRPRAQGGDGDFVPP